jgi:hypothetical protein
MILVGRRIGAMSVASMVCGSGSSLAAGGRAVPAREGVPAVLATRRCRKEEPKRSVGNTEKVCRKYRKYRKPLAGSRMGGRKLLQRTTSPPNRGYDREGMEKGSE